MLVLSRKMGEQIHIDNSITVTLLSIEGKRVRLGFEAPAEVPILRKELAIDLDRHDCRLAESYETEPIANST